MFGASALSLSVGNQATSKDVSDNYYAPSLLHYSKPMYTFGIHSIFPITHEINNVVVTSPMNSNSTSPYEKGNVSQNKSNLNLFYFHSLFSFLPKTKLAISFYSPITRLMDTSTGDSYLPEYVFYRSRNSRTESHMSLILGSKDLSYSLGLYSGLQSSGEASIVGRINGSSEPSSGKILFNASPSWSLMASVTKTLGEDKIYFSFRDKIISHFETKAVGLTPIDNTNASFPYDMKLSSILFFDPAIYRLGYIKKFSQKTTFYGSLEYQNWDGYNSPKMKIKNDGGIITSSKNHENLKTKNPLIPHLGMALESYSFGFSMRPKVIDSNLNDTGSAIDTDLYNFSLGKSFIFNLFDKEITLQSSYLLQKLKAFKVHKTPNREDGAPGQKLGSPGYRVGGEIHVFSFSVSWVI